MSESQAHGIPGDAGKRRYLPPVPVGTPYEGDPKQPFPFETESAPQRPSQASPFPHGEPPPGTAQAETPVGAPPGFGTAPGEPPLMMPPEFTQSRMRSKNVDIPRRHARTALWVSIASLLFFGIVLGPIGFVLGIRSVREGEKSLGWWAIAVGLTGFISSAVLLVLVATGTIENPFDTLGRAKGAQ